MALGSALDSALSGLRVAQQQLDVISNNIANVSTTGYTRKILPQSTQVLQDSGRPIGVQAEKAIRNVDMNLLLDIFTQVSLTSASDVKASYMNQIQQFHGSADSEMSIAAELADLKDTFAALADSPTDEFLLSGVVNQAQTFSNKVNDFSQLLTQMRNNAENELSVSIARVNDLLEEIANLNAQVRTAHNLNRSSAAIEDLRDQAVHALSEEIEISFFTRGDGVMVVQTNNGVQLVDETATEVFFQPSNISTQHYYPDSINGIYVGGNPAKFPGAFDISSGSLGGNIGGLIEMRDEYLPKYQAQLDELSYQTARRFDLQGLRLFTNASGTLPDNTAPDPTPLPPGSPARPVSYVGFSETMQVNESILSDYTLIQQGTYSSDITIQDGSNEVIRRILEFTFSDTYCQEAVGTVNLDITTTGSADLQEHLGLYSSNQVVTGLNLSQYSEIDSNPVAPAVNASDELITSFTDYFPNWPNEDQFQLQLYDRSGAALAPITIDLSAIGANPLYATGAAHASLPDGQIDTALDQVVAAINDEITALGPPADLNVQATYNTNGQLVIESRGNVEFVDSGFGADAMGSSSFQALFGFSAQLFTTENPYFNIQIGNQDAVRIEILPGETHLDLYNKLQKTSIADSGVAGLYVDDADFTATNTLTLRPGIDDTGLGGPYYGGDMRITFGPHQADGTGVAAAGASVLSSLFGSDTPISSISYDSETREVAGVGSGKFVSFRTAYLGPDLSIGTEVLSGHNLIDYSQKIINQHAQETVLIESLLEDETQYQTTLERRMADESGVNLDEEMSMLIVMQNAYSASARAITTISDMFDELMALLR